MVRKWIIYGGAWVCLCVALAVGCDSSSSDVAGDVSDAGAESIVDGPFDQSKIYDDVQDADACKAMCSSDLHSVLDCSGNVETVCPSETACLDGICGDPCMSAEENQSARGCEYYATVPPKLVASGRCLAVAVENTWTTDVSIKVEYQGVSLDGSGFERLPPIDDPKTGTYRPLPDGRLPPGQVALLFLASRRGDCPSGVTPAITDRLLEKQGSTITDAFHIIADRPVAASLFVPYNGGNLGYASATMLLPTSAWTGNYIAQTPYVHTFSADPGYPTNYIQIVAKEDSTSVEIQPSVDIIGNQDAGDLYAQEPDAAVIGRCPKGGSQTYSLNKGQVLQLLQATELVGSTISSEKPIAVWGGATLLNVEPDEYAEEWAHQQVLPITSIGRNYAAVTYRERIPGTVENPPWRIVGVVDGTELSYFPSKPANAPSSIDKGEAVIFKFKGTPDAGVDYEAPFPFIVRSQDDDHPFYFWAYMTGGDAYGGRGDPEWVPVVPMEQFDNASLLFTTPSYPETTMTVVRKKVGDHFEAVTLGCAGPLQDWQAIEDGGAVEFSHITLVSNGLSQNGCMNGRQALTSVGPFTVTAWGWGGPDISVYTSYALPGGLLGHSVNSVIVPIIH